MKFNKEMSNGTLSIPSGVFKISGFEHDEMAEIHALDSAVVVLKQQMTAMELIQAMDALHQLSVELTVRLAEACDDCNECADGCPYDDPDDDIHLPSDVLEEAGIPVGAKLRAYADDEEQTVTIGVAGYDHDLRDVPPYLLDMLAEAGICLGELEEHLMTEKILYGE